ncbi:PTS system D-fructose-specific IIBCA component (F1P-forming), Frc family [Coriobacterium glomerans PW2]|uniref:PTS system D-fructose-specific IIBCA component (F1P-forming), Frc family n=1 Tax=Coriobacterium glomerans (strain ATCC 49209 / DSM 20642 / JCM 10262 / PW2) TaxID=700015 RepID=F2N835_CORGP|nr:fructose-specific PTS transporter subunit EIIC [Coriobacterium glomerans]AEB07218.1 PTS system D-fructose-specific IIBCA component (F1P-forming), Frc family [Coriobacterium glomerans PW2]
MSDTFDIVAATGCPTGIAHTYMAKEALERAAEARGLSIKVETHGQVGVEDELTAAEIAGARAVVIAADKDVDADRFAGRPQVSVSVSKALSAEAAGVLIDRALAAEGTRAQADRAAAEGAPRASREHETIVHQLYRHLMNGVSHMLVFVVAGGVLTAMSFLWGITSYDSTAADYSAFAAMLKTIGGIAMNLMVPVLSAYIAESIGDRPALVPGFVAGMIAIQGLPVNATTGLIDAGGTGVGFGFLGGIVGGFLAGYVIVALEHLLRRLPQSLGGLKAIFLYPLFSTLIVGIVMLAISVPMAWINTSMMSFLQSLRSSGPIVLGLAIGCMCAFDMGGPVNKAAYATGTFLLGSALEAGVGTRAYDFGTNFMAAVSAACIVPPLITAFAVIVGRRWFSREDHDAGVVNLILGSTHITEGAIPFMTKNIWPVMPIMMIGSSIASILTIMFNVHDPAPHGGFLVIPVVEGWQLWVASILAGTVVGGLLFVGFKRADHLRREHGDMINGGVAPRSATVSPAGSLACKESDAGAQTSAVDARAVASSGDPSAAGPQAGDPQGAPSDDGKMQRGFGTGSVTQGGSEASKGFVCPEDIFVDVDFSTRDEVIDFLSREAVSRGHADDASALAAAFLEREAEGSTGMMDGFAIPHAKAATVRDAAVMIVKDPSGIDGWDTMDDKPINIAIALLIPDSEAGSTHLRLLSRVAEALMDEDLRQDLRKARSREAIAQIVNERLS